MHLSRFLRVTSTGRRIIREIDGLRFIAVMAVIAFHVAGYVEAKAPVTFTTPPRQDLVGSAMFQGNHGVELFFVISGFILALPFAAQHLKGAAPVQLRRYYMRRLTRLEPPFIISLLLCAFLYGYAHGLSITRLLPHLAAGLVYLHCAIFGFTNPINSVTWSLEIEVQFYLLAPLLAKVYFERRKWVRRMALFAATLAVVACKVFLIVPHSRVYLSLANEFDFFLVGFLLADIYLSEWDEKPAKSVGWDWLTPAAWVLMLGVWNWSAITPWLFPPVTLLAYCAAFRGRFTSAFLSHPLLVAVGGMCYTLYLLHGWMIAIFGKCIGTLIIASSFGLSATLQLLLMLVPIVLLGGVFYMLVERPCMDPKWPVRLGVFLRSITEGRMKTPQTLGSVGD